MQTMDQALAQLVKKEIVKREEAILISNNPEKIEELLRDNKVKV